jgi:peptidoglycan/LPS O-acetylase OafA/YrhL
VSGRPVDHAGAVGRASTSDAEQSFGYRPHLDGLRTVAVYLVLLFHAGVGRAAGGFIGVDVFFVLSGYLVTRLLLVDLDGTGRVGLPRFYARRVRRLLPAALVVLFATAVVFPAVATPAAVDEVRRSFQAALLYVANWHFIAESADYFSPDTDGNPVLHYWSLSVEEQFYIVWPLLLAALHRVTRGVRRPDRARAAAVGLAVLASAAWALWLAVDDPVRAYYGTDARAYQLLAGALLALVLRRTDGRMARGSGVPSVAAAAALGGVLLLATSVVDVGPVTRGCMVTVLVVVLLAGLEGAPAGLVPRVLAAGPMVELGRLSYSTYLWHWPLIVVGGLVTERTFSPLATFAVVALLATALASLSQALLESPIRRAPRLDRRPRAVIAVGLAAGLAGAVLVVPRALDADRTSTLVATGSIADGGVSLAGLDLDRESARTDVGAELQDVAFLPNWSCAGQPSSACTIVEGDGPHILVIGDSHAWSLFATFARVAQEEDLTLSTAAAAGCPWQRALYDADSPPDGCETFKQDLYERVVPELDPDIVIAASNDYLGPPGRPSFELRAGDAEVPAGLAGDDAFDWAMEDSLAALTAGGARVLLVEPMPVAADGQDPFACLGAAATVDECRFVASADGRAAAAYRRFAEGGEVSTADLALLVCPGFPICDPVVNGEVVRLDGEHLTPKFAVTIAEPVRRLLHDLGLLP